MRRIVLFAALILLFSTTVYSAEWAFGSGNKQADAKIWAGDGSFYGIAVVADGTNAITVSIYDNTSATGTLIVPTFIVPATATSGYSFSVSPAVRFNNGIYVDITCSGTANYIVYYGR